MSVPVAILLSLVLLVIFWRVFGSIVNLRVFVPVLAVVLLIVAYGIDTAPATAELGHFLSNLFGGTHE